MIIRNSRKNRKTIIRDSKAIWYNSWRRIIQNSFLSISTGKTFDILTFHLKTFLSLDTKNYITRDRFLYTQTIKPQMCRKGNLINEYFSEFSDIILPILVYFLNKILDSGILPCSAMVESNYYTSPQKRKYQRSREQQRNQYHQ